MRVLLHTCCGPCTIGPFRALSAEGHAVTGFFCNPNVHPLLEFRRRLKAQKVLQEHLPIPMIYEEHYGLGEFLARVDWRAAAGRCADCYRLRLERAARTGLREGFEAFTTTLLASAHQDHDLVRRIGAECAEAEGTVFLYRDWRPLAEGNHREAARLGLYRQQYCGCIFSEQERFVNTRKHLYRGPGPSVPRDG